MPTSCDSYAHHVAQVTCGLCLAKNHLDQLCRDWTLCQRSIFSGYVQFSRAGLRAWLSALTVFGPLVPKKACERRASPFNCKHNHVEKPPLRRFAVPTANHVLGVIQSFGTAAEVSGLCLASPADHGRTPEAHCGCLLQQTPLFDMRDVDYEGMFQSV